jgi:Signal transduction histidine kinase regulating C4-dicarboxylate transport system
MKNLKFEHNITLAYLTIGCLWILFSDQILNTMIKDLDLNNEIQTYKGWFYVLITSILFYLFLRKHLRKLRKTEQELGRHKKNLQQLVDSKTEELDLTIKKLNIYIEELREKNELINTQNAELKKAFNELKETQSQLYQADKMASLGVLTAGVAHEINNPLNFISGGLAGLEIYLDEDINNNKNLGLFINSIKTGIERASSIVSSLNQLNRNNQTYDEICDIHYIIENCLTIIHSQMDNRIELNKEYANGDLITLGNCGQLHQVFINILVNACQAIENKGIITIRTENNNDFASIRITDTGCGISEENLPKITDPFFTTKEPGKGTGLGLSITYNIIQAHGGKINFQSEVGVGTSVLITLPTRHQEKNNIDPDNQ